MLIGVPREIKSDELRVGLTPESVRALVRQGHRVLVESNAGCGIGAGGDPGCGCGRQQCRAGCRRRWRGVTMLDRDARALARLAAAFGTSVRGVIASPASIAQHLTGAVLVDIAIDQGGCCETSRPTTHHDPVYVVDGVLHYCVANMPGAVPRTSTFALNHATLPHVLALADQGVRAALARDPHLRAGLNVHAGRITHPGVAGALGMPACDPLVAIS